MTDRFKDYKYIIPEVWYHMIEKYGRLFVSNETLSQTDKPTLESFALSNKCVIKEVNGGVFIQRAGSVSE